MIGLLDLSSDQRRALLGIAELCLGRFSKPPRKWISHREQADGPCLWMAGTGREAVRASSQTVSAVEQLHCEGLVDWVGGQVIPTRSSVQLIRWLQDEGWQPDALLG